MGTHYPSKEQVSSCINKHGKEYVKHHILGQKNKYMCKIKVTDVIEQVRKRNWTQARQPAYEKTDGHCVSPSGNHMKEKYLEEDRRYVETNWTTTGRVPSGKG